MRIRQTGSVMSDVNRLFVQPNLPMNIARICGILIQHLKSRAVVDVVDIFTLRSHTDEIQEHEEHERNKPARHPTPPHFMASRTRNLPASKETKKRREKYLDPLPSR